MTLLNENDFKDRAVEQAALDMCLAARTAPKTRGRDLIMTAIAKADTVAKLADKMEEIFVRTGREAFKRNAEPVRSCSHIVLVGAKKMTQGLAPCSFCGFKDCAECESNKAACAFNSIDLGIAVSSAVSVAEQHRADNRIMWTIGMAALDLKLLGEDVKMILGIPLSATGKNVFFDRK